MARSNSWWVRAWAMAAVKAFCLALLSAEAAWGHSAAADDCATIGGQVKVFFPSSETSAVGIDFCQIGSALEPLQNSYFDLITASELKKLNKTIAIYRFLRERFPGGDAGSPRGTVDDSDYCYSVGGSIEFLTSSKGTPLDFCKFSDLSMLNTSALYLQHIEFKQVLSDLFPR